MWMITSLPKSLFKWKLAVLCIVIISVIIGGLSFSIDRHLPKYAFAFCSLINQQLAVKISFSSIRYRFPNTLILKHVQVLAPNGKTPMLEAPRIEMGFTIPLSSSGPSLNFMKFNEITIDFPLLKNYWRQYSRALYAWAKALRKKNLRLLVPNGKFYPKGLGGDPFPFNMDFSLKQNHVDVRGSWQGGDKFDYELYGDFVGPGFNLGKLNVEGGASSINLWGRWQNNNIDWKGFILYKKFYILDINGHLKIQDTAIVLKGLSFSVNGDNVTALGHCSRQKFFQCDADMTFSRQKQHQSAQEPLKDMDLRLHAQNTAQGLFFTGQSDLNFLFDPNASFILQSVHLDFKNLKARVINTDFLKFKINHMEASWVSHDKHKFLVDDFLASIHLTQPSLATMALSARMYAGRSRGRIFLDTTAIPWQIKTQGQLDSIDISRLGSAFSIFRQCHGIANGRFDLQSLQNMKMSGTLTIHHGDFNPHFLPWVAKILQMPTLDHLSGADLSCHFKIEKNSKMLEDLQLHSDELDLNGFFHLDSEDLVSSRISVLFSKALLSESPIGRNIIGMVRGAWTLPFEFRLSGKIYRMNFQWDNSPLKDKVRQHIFAFVKRIIDRRMDANPYMITQSPGF